MKELKEFTESEKWLKNRLSDYDFSDKEIVDLYTKNTMNKIFNNQ